MHRSLLQPIRTCRVVRSEAALREDSNADSGMTPDMRKTLAAIGALWVTFATSSVVAMPAIQSAPSKNPLKTQDDFFPRRKADLENPWIRPDRCSPWREACGPLALLEGPLDSAALATHDSAKKLVSQ
jgi:hypothetical protein